MGLEFTLVKDQVIISWHSQPLDHGATLSLFTSRDVYTKDIYLSAVNAIHILLDLDEYIYNYFMILVQREREREKMFIIE